MSREGSPETSRSSATLADNSMDLSFSGGAFSGLTPSSSSLIFSSAVVVSGLVSSLHFSVPPQDAPSFLIPKDAGSSVGISEVSNVTNDEIETDGEVADATDGEVSDATATSVSSYLTPIPFAAFQSPSATSSIAVYRDRQVGLELLRVSEDSTTGFKNNSIGFGSKTIELGGGIVGFERGASGFTDARFRTASGKFCGEENRSTGGSPSLSPPIVHCRRSHLLRHERQQSTSLSLGGSTALGYGSVTSLRPPRRTLSGAEREGRCETPAAATLVSHQLLQRAGIMRSKPRELLREESLRPAIPISRPETTKSPTSPDESLSSQGEPFLPAPRSVSMTSLRSCAESNAGPTVGGPSQSTGATEEWDCRGSATTAPNASLSGVSISLAPSAGLPPKLFIGNESCATTGCFLTAGRWLLETTPAMPWSLDSDPLSSGSRPVNFAASELSGGTVATRTGGELTTLDLGSAPGVPSSQSFPFVPSFISGEVFVGAAPSTLPTSYQQAVALASPQALTSPEPPAARTPPAVASAQPPTQPQRRLKLSKPRLKKIPKITGETRRATACFGRGITPAAQPMLLR